MGAGNSTESSTEPEKKTDRFGNKIHSRIELCSMCDEDGYITKEVVCPLCQGIGNVGQELCPNAECINGHITVTVVCEHGDDWYHW